MRASVALRALVVAFLVLALAEPRLARPVRETAVAFLLDSSFSVPAAERERATTWVAEAIESSRLDRAAVVAFGARPMVDRPARLGPLDPVRSLPGRDRTDIAGALRVGVAVLPADAGRRVVLLSDGRANMGDTDRQIDLALAQRVPVDIVPLAAEAAAGETLVAALEAPANTRVGQRFDLTAVIKSLVDTAAHVQISDGTTVLLDEQTNRPSCAPARRG
jgi:hypothetical protein